MLAQSFVSKLLDLKKSSSAFLMFFVLCFFCSVEMVSVDRVLVLTNTNELSELVKRAVVLQQGNKSWGREHVIQSPLANGNPISDGPPSNEKPYFKPGPPSNE